MKKDNRKNGDLVLTSGNDFKMFQKKAYKHAHMPPRGYNPYFRLVDDYVYIVLNSCHLIKMAGSTRLELAASGVTGRRYNQLNYDPALCSKW